MGYYTGTGIVKGGGSAVSPFHTYLWNGFHTVYQRITSTTTQKPGVSGTTARAELGECSLSSHTFYSGGSNYNAYNCKGTRKNVSYSQIGESNLYELNINNETIVAKLDDGSWVS